MAEFIYSGEQEEIFKYAEHGVLNMIVQAVAGAGKTTTLIECANRVRSDYKIILLAHNKSTKDTLKQKIKDKSNVKVFTIHGLAWRMFTEHFGFEPKINENKYRNYINQNIEKIGSEIFKELNAVSKMIYKANVFKLIDLARYNLKQSEREVKKLAEKKYGMTLIADESHMVANILKWGVENNSEVDFQDLLWYPSELGYFTKLYTADVIMLDEAQDASIAQQDVISRCFKRNTRLFAFGDKDQCQPAGTKVLLTDYTEKNIEDIEVGDCVMTYNPSETGIYSYYSPKSQGRKGCKVVAISERMVDETIKIHTENNRCSEYSINHICYAKFNRDECKNKYALYLMRNEQGMWRIGKSKLFKNEKEGLGPRIRLKYEKCSEAWILCVSDTNKDIMLKEAFISAKFGIPQCVFNPDRASHKNSECQFNNDDIFEYCHQYLGDITDRAKQCLKYFGRDIRYPFIEKGTTEKYARDHMFKTMACNLIEGIMSVNYFDKENYDERSKSGKTYKFYRCAYTPITKIETINKRQKVYSLEVEKRHNYVADGILTHNCINSWAGSDMASFEHLADATMFRREAKELSLTTNYRCGTRIIEYAKQYTNNNIHAREGAPEGEIRHGVYLSEVTDGDMILCRNISPLMEVYRRGVAAGKKMYFRGEELGKVLQTDVDCAYGDTIEEIIKSMKTRLIATWEFLTRELKLDPRETMTDPRVVSLFDTIKTMESLPKTVVRRSDLEKFITDVFSNEGREGIQLSTIHRAKGLESDNVFIVCPSLIPSRLARLDWEIEEERHLQYVMSTRPKNTLNFITEKEISPYYAFSENNAFYKELTNIKADVNKE